VTVIRIWTCFEDMGGSSVLFRARVFSSSECSHTVLAERILTKW